MCCGFDVLGSGCCVCVKIAMLGKFGLEWILNHHREKIDIII